PSRCAFDAPLGRILLTPMEFARARTSARRSTRDAERTELFRIPLGDPVATHRNGPALSIILEAQDDHVFVLPLPTGSEGDPERTRRPFGDLEVRGHDEAEAWRAHQLAQTIERHVLLALIDHL